MSLLSALKTAAQKINPFAVFGKEDSSGIPFQSDDPEAFMAEVQKELESRQQRKGGYEKMWFMNIAFVLGKHYVQWSDASRKFIDQKVPEWRVRVPVNKIVSRYRQNLSLLTSYDPRAVCTPNSTEIEDIEAAELGTKILNGMRDKLHLKKIQLKRARRQLLTGNGFVTLPYWDSTAGEEIRDTDEMGNPIVFNIGDVAVEAVSPFELYPLGECTEIDDCPAMARVTQTTVSEIRMLYPEKGQEVSEEKQKGNVGLYLDRIEDLVSTTGMPGISLVKEKSGIVSYVRVWIRPTPKFPRGRYLAYANNIVLETGDIPNIELGKEYEIPFLKYDDLTVEGRFWAQATIEQSIPINKELNKTRSQIIENRNLMGKPKWTVAKGTVAKTAIDSSPGEVIEVDMTKPGAFPPTVQTPASLPAYILNLCAMLERDIADIFASHESTMGELEPGIRSGKAIAELKSSDTAEKGFWMIQEAENKRIFNRALLKLVQAKYSETRQLKIIGEGGKSEVISFMGADLKNNTDVWIETSDIIPIDRDARQAMVLKFYDAGLLGDKNNDEVRKRALRMLQFGMVDEIWEEGSLDAKEARRENREMRKGILQRTAAYDNHITHISEHMKGMKTPMFKRLPIEIQAVFERHLGDHQTALTPPAPPATLTPAQAGPQWSIAPPPQATMPPAEGVQ